MKFKERCVFVCEKDGNPTCVVVGELGPGLYSVIFDGMEEMGATPVLRTAVVPVEEWNQKHPGDRK